MKNLTSFVLVDMKVTIQIMLYYNQHLSHEDLLRRLVANQMANIDCSLHKEQFVVQ